MFKVLDLLLQLLLEVVPFEPFEDLNDFITQVSAPWLNYRMWILLWNQEEGKVESSLLHGCGQQGWLTEGALKG